MNIAKTTTAAIVTATAATLTSYLLEKEAYTTAKAAATAAVKGALDAFKATGLTTEKALKALRKGLVENGIDRRRVSEVLLELGFRDRAAASKKTDESEALAPIVDRVFAFAQSENAENVVAVLRRAYLKAQATAKAVSA